MVDLNSVKSVRKKYKLGAMEKKKLNDNIEQLHSLISQLYLDEVKKEGVKKLTDDDNLLRYLPKCTEIVLQFLHQNLVEHNHDNMDADTMSHD